MQENNGYKQKLYYHTLPVQERVWQAIESRLPPQKEDRPFPLFWLILFAGAIAGGVMMVSQPAFRQNPFTTGNNTKIVNSHPEIYPETAGKDRDDITGVQTQTNGTVYSQEKVSSNKDMLSQTKLSEVYTSSPDSHTSSYTSYVAPPNSEAIAISQPYTYPEEIFNPRSIHISAPVAMQHTHNKTEALPCLDMEGITSAPAAIAIAPKPDANCYRFGNTALGFALSADLFGGPGYSPRIFTDTGGESSIYAEARRSTERYQYAWSAGARINLHLSNGLSARIGLLYHQAGDLFNYRDSLAMQSTTRIDSFFSADGTFLYAESVTVVIPGTLIKKIHNTYRQLDIPLLAGYEVPWGRSTLMLNAGPVINLVSYHKGQALDPMLHPRHIAPGGHPSSNVEMYKSRFGLSFYLGAGAILPLGHKLSAIIEPRILYRLKPVSLDGFALEECRHFAGINFGLQYHLK